jgi:hypothetical protein
MVHATLGIRARSTKADCMDFPWSHGPSKETVGVKVTISLLPVESIVLECSLAAGLIGDRWGHPTTATRPMPICAAHPKSHARRPATRPDRGSLRMSDRAGREAAKRCLAATTADYRHAADAELRRAPDAPAGPRQRAPIGDRPGIRPPPRSRCRSSAARPNCHFKGPLRAVIGDRSGHPNG